MKLSFTIELQEKCDSECLRIRHPDSTGHPSSAGLLVHKIGRAVPASPERPSAELTEDARCRRGAEGVPCALSGHEPPGTNPGTKKTPQRTLGDKQYAMELNAL